MAWLHMMTAKAFLSTPSARRATRNCGGKVAGRAFLSTPSARRATGRPHRLSSVKSISIHALREEGDLRPRITVIQLYAFLSTPSARRATDYTPIVDVRAIISIHALREEGDRYVVVIIRQCDISIHALREEGDSY